MIINSIIRKILNKPLKSYLIPIRQTEPYYCFLESKFFELRNPFRMLLLKTKSDTNNVSCYYNLLGNSEKTGRIA